MNGPYCSTWRLRHYAAKRGVLLTAALAAATSLAPPCRGQGISLTPPPVYTGRADVFAPADQAKDALPILDWLVYPSALTGIVVDSNPLQLPAGAELGEGLRFAPNVVAERAVGIHDTKVYGSADARVFPGQSAANFLSANAGVTEVYRPLPDLIFNLQGNFTRQQSVFSTLPSNTDLTIPNLAGIGLAPSQNPATYNQFSGNISGQKNLSDAFVILDLSAAELTFDRTSNTLAPAPDLMAYTGRARAGWWLIPDLYGYVEGSLDTRTYSTASLNSSGYRSAVGVGSDQIGFFRGELYAGLQSEAYRSNVIGAVGGPLFGGRVFYFPLPRLSLGIDLDELLGATSVLSAAPGTAGTATRVTSLLGEANYVPAPEWSVSAHGGYIHTSFVGSPQRDDALTIGTTVTYSIWRTFGITFDYQHTDLNSNTALSGFSRDTVTIGATYRY